MKRLQPLMNYLNIIIYTIYTRGRQTFLGRGPDESQTSLSRARLEKNKSTHPNVNMTKRGDACLKLKE